MAQRGYPKILIVGDIGTGKTSIIKRYTANTFTAQYKSTIGVDFATKTPQSDNVIAPGFQLWDIAGQERYGNLTRVYYRGAEAAFVVFDVTRPSTLSGAMKWKLDIDAKVCMPNSDAPLPVVLVANKMDMMDTYGIGVYEMYRKSNSKGLYGDKTKEELDEFCKTNNFITWSPVSAKDNDGINDMFNLFMQ